jgi:hypothetical protein
MLEKTLVDLLHEHNTHEYKGNNGWTPDAWNKIVKEFQEREIYAGFSKVQIQEKEKVLKRDYRMLKDARKQSGVSWDEKRCMIQADPPIWDNIIKVSLLPCFCKFEIFIVCCQFLANLTFSFLLYCAVISKG